MSSFDDRYDNEFPELVVEGEFDEILSKDEFIERSRQENLNEGTPSDYELIHYDRAKQELAIATTVDETPSTIKNWRDEGKLEYFQVPGSTRVLYPRESIEDFERQHTKKAKVLEF